MLKKLFLKIAFSKAGPPLTAAIAGGIGLLAAKGAEYGVIITPDQANEFAVWTAGTLFTVAQTLILGENSANVKKIQEATGETPDGWAGPATVKAVEDTVVSPARSLPKIGGPGK